MHVVTTKREYKGKTYETHLLQRSFREDGKVKHETLANLSHLPVAIVASIRAQLKGEKLVAAESLFTPVASVPHGHVRAVLTVIRALGIPGLVSSTASRERDLIVAMIAARILFPDSKLATTRRWLACTLASELGVADASDDELYAAMDWLDERQGRIEKKLAKRHLADGQRALYDLSSSYFEGEKCPLARLGYSRDGKRGTLQVNYGLLADGEGRPIAISVYPGNTGDSSTVPDQLLKLRHDFKLKNVCLVGDRGMLGDKQVEAIREQNSEVDRLDWITALKSGKLRALVADGTLQLGLFDESNLYAFAHPDFPGERLMACRNPVLGRLRAFKREDMLQATRGELEKVQRLVAKGKLVSGEAIGVRVGKVVDKYCMAKHLRLDIADGHLAFEVDAASVAREALMDGIYVLRTSLSAAHMDDAEVVRVYKSLQQVERAFRAFKGVDLLVRPIHHRLEERVRAHLFICMLAYYVLWHLKRAWAPMLFIDEDLEGKADRDPVAPAQRSAEALAKASHQQLPDGTPTHSYATLMAELATLSRVTMSRNDGGKTDTSYNVEVAPTDLQRRALELAEAVAL